MTGENHYTFYFDDGKINRFIFKLSEDKKQLETTIKNTKHVCKLELDNS